MNKFLRLVLSGVLIAVIVSTPVLAATIEESQRPYLNLIRARQAQTITKGRGVVVAVIDTGVDAGHPDLRGALLPGFHVNKQSASAANSDPDGHGTAMTGIIVARGGGYNNVLGIAPEAKVLPVAMDFEAANVSGTLRAAVRWAVDHGAKILNMSIARPSYEPLSRGEVEAIAYAQSKDVVVIVSAGNTKDLTGGNNVAALPGVVAVAGTTLTGGEYFGSEKRDYNAIAAPGKDIVTTGARNIHSTGFVSDSGTSPATAVVSGVTALIRAKYPKMNAANVVNRLIKTAMDKGTPGRDKVYGYGIVDAYAALTANVASVDKNPLGVINLQNTNQSGTAQTDKPNASAAIFQLGIFLLVVAGIVFGIVMIVRAERRKKAQSPLPGSLPPTPYQPPGGQVVTGSMPSSTPPIVPQPPQNPSGPPDQNYPPRPQQ